MKKLSLLFSTAIVFFAIGNSFGSSSDKPIVKKDGAIDSPITENHKNNNKQKNFSKKSKHLKGKKIHGTKQNKSTMKNMQKGNKSLEHSLKHSEKISKLKSLNRMIKFDK